MRPAVFTRNMYGEFSVENFGHIGIMVGHRRRAAKQITDSSPPKAHLAGNAKALLYGWMFGAVNLRAPFAPALPCPLAKPWKDGEIKMIVNVYQPRQHEIAGKVNRHAIRCVPMRPGGAGHIYAFDTRSPNRERAIPGV